MSFVNRHLRECDDVREASSVWGSWLFSSEPFRNLQFHAAKAVIVVAVSNLEKLIKSEEQIDIKDIFSYPLRRNVAKISGRIVPLWFHPNFHGYFWIMYCDRVTRFTRGIGNRANHKTKDESVLVWLVYPGLRRTSVLLNSYKNLGKYLTYFLLRC
jgi:hypothetical protein